MAVTQNKIIYPQVQKTASAITPGAKTTYNNAGNSTAIFTAGADGSILTRLTVIARGTMTATQLQLYVIPNGSATIYFINSALLPAQTMTQTAAFTPTDFGYTAANPLRLAGGDSLRVAAGVFHASSIIFHAEYQDY